MTGTLVRFPDIPRVARSTREPDDAPCEVVVLPVVRIERVADLPAPLLVRRGRRSLLAPERA